MNANIRNILAVARREFNVRARTRTFVIATAFLAVAGVAVALAPIAISWFEGGGSGQEEVGVVTVADPPPATNAVGQLSSILNASATDGQGGYAVQASPDEAAARTAVDEGELSAAIVVDRGEDGDLAFVVISEETAGPAHARAPPPGGALARRRRPARPARCRAGRPGDAVRAGRRDDRHPHGTGARRAVDARRVRHDRPGRAGSRRLPAARGRPVRPVGGHERGGGEEQPGDGDRHQRGDAVPAARRQGARRRRPRAGAARRGRVPGAHRVRPSRPDRRGRARRAAVGPDRAAGADARRDRGVLGLLRPRLPAVRDALCRGRGDGVADGGREHDRGPDVAHRDRGVPRRRLCLDRDRARRRGLGHAPGVRPVHEPVPDALACTSAARSVRRRWRSRRRSSWSPSLSPCGSRPASTRPVSSCTARHRASGGCSPWPSGGDGRAKRRGRSADDRGAAARDRPRTSRRTQSFLRRGSGHAAQRHDRRVARTGGGATRPSTAATRSPDTKHGVGRNRGRPRRPARRGPRRHRPARPPRPAPCRRRAAISSGGRGAPRRSRPSRAARRAPRPSPRAPPSRRRGRPASGGRMARRSAS